MGKIKGISRKKEKISKKIGKKGETW